MSVVIDGSTGVSKIQDNVIISTNLQNSIVTGAKLAANAVEQGFTTPLSNRNILINAGFDVWQRATSIAVTPTSGIPQYVTVDRWFLAQDGVPVQQFFDRATGISGRYGLKFGRSSGHSNTPNKIITGQNIETQNAIALRGKTVSLSFKAHRGAIAPTTLYWTIVSGTGSDQSTTTCLNGTWTGYTVVGTGSVTVTETQTQFAVTASIPSNSSQLCVMFHYVPTGTASSTEWFQLEQIQLEHGVATPFEFRLISTELALCQRYFVNIGKSASSEVYMWGYIYSSGAVGGTVVLPVEMRSSPTVTVVGTFTLNNVVAPVINSSGTKSFSVYASGITLGLGGWGTVVNTGYFTASIEL
jgi:hypothetical protein